MEFLSFNHFHVENWTKWETEPNNPEDSFWFEEIDEEFWYNFREQFWWIAYLLTGGYWIGIHWCQNIMKNRPPIKNVRGYMFIYNVIVGVVSIVALWRISPRFFSNLNLTPEGIHNSLCYRYTAYNKESFWAVFSVWFKVFHFLDTLFIVLRKKPIQYIQMYHHTLAALIPQSTFPFGEPVLNWIGITNLIQHAITYPFFACKSIKMKVPKWISSFVLSVELVQMIIGVSFGIYTSYDKNNGGDCIRHPKSIAIFNFAYITMLILVLHMAFDHFVIKNRVKTKKNK